MRAVAVVLGCPDMYARCADLLDGAFARYSMRTLFRAADFSRLLPTDARGKFCRCGCAQDFVYPLAEEELARVRIEEELPPALALPVRAGQPVGNLQIFFAKQLLFSQKIVTIESMNKGILDILRGIAEKY